MIGDVQMINDAMNKRYCIYEIRVACIYALKDRGAASEILKTLAAQKEDCV